MKDYYAALGVSESASADEIKKAYRKLAKENHPDATGGDARKSDKFKEASEAYGVLSDETKRSQYDQIRKNPFAQNAEFGGDTGIDIGEIFAQFFGGGVGRGGRRGTGRAGNSRVSFDFGDFGNYGQGQGQGMPGGDFFSDMFGGGRGGRQGGQPGQAGRRGRARQAAQISLLELDLREAVLGTVKTLTVGRDTVQVRIPPGVSDGTRLRAGDLSLEIRVRPHPQFRREGADLHHDLAISVGEALLGGKVEVPTIDGKVAMSIPAGTSSGATLRLRGKGVAHANGTRGDQLVHIRIVVPREISPQVRKLAEELEAAMAFRPRQTAGP